MGRWENGENGGLAQATESQDSKRASGPYTEGPKGVVCGNDQQSDDAMP